MSNSLRTLILMFVVAALAAGCATSRSMRLADGWQTHVVSCGGPFLNFGHCLEKAGDICGGYGYTILNKAGGELPPPEAMPSGGGPDMPKSLMDFSPRQLHIRCN